MTNTHDVCKFCQSTDLWGSHFDAAGYGDARGKWDVLCQDCGKFQIRRNPRGGNTTRTGEDGRYRIWDGA